MTRPLKLAVVGVGVMGRHHANVLRMIPDAELVAVVDPDPERLRDAGALFSTRCYSDIEALLAAEELDAVSVAAPTNTHFILTKRLLEAGVHVLVEKPVATTVAEADALAQLSVERGLVLQVGHITRFFRAVKRLQAEVRDPYLIEARRLSPNGRIQDVGVVLDLMIHDIDIVLGLVQSDIVEFSVAGQRFGQHPHEDVCAAQVRFENGCVARFLASRVAPDAERTLVIAERQRTFRLDFLKEPHTEMTVYRPAPPEDANGVSVGDGIAANRVLVDRHVVFEDNPLKKQLTHFLARVRGTAEPIGTLHDDIRALTLARELLLRLAEQGVSDDMIVPELPLR